MVWGKDIGSGGNLKTVIFYNSFISIKYSKKLKQDENQPTDGVQIQKVDCPYHDKDARACQLWCDIQVKIFILILIEQ